MPPRIFGEAHLARPAAGVMPGNDLQCGTVYGDKVYANTDFSWNWWLFGWHTSTNDPTVNTGNIVVCPAGQTKIGGCVTAVPGAAPFGRIGYNPAKKRDWSY